MFVGGSGRSGTTIVGRLIGTHSAYLVVLTELRFHAENRGLPGILGGNQSIDAFARLMHERWHPARTRRRSPAVSVEDFESALEQFLLSVEEDPLTAASELLRGVLDSSARRAGKQSWVEMTPYNAIAAPTLIQLIPEAKFVNMVRDGRDVATSVSTIWGVHSPAEALDWWVTRVRGAYGQLARVPAARVLHLRLEDLARDDRERAYRGLLDFLGLEDEAKMRDFFEQTVSAGAAGIGRWRALPPADREAVEARYPAALQELARHGVHVAAAPNDPETQASARSRQTSRSRP